MTTPASSRARLSPASIVACFFFLFANSVTDQWILQHRSVTLWLGGSLLAAAALVYWLWRGENDIMSGHDELQQKIRTEALARSFPCAIAVVLLLGKLRAAGHDISFPFSVANWVLPILPYFVILAWCKRRYQ